MMKAIYSHNNAAYDANTELIDEARKIWRSYYKIAVPQSERLLKDLTLKAKIAERSGDQDAINTYQSYIKQLSKKLEEFALGDQSLKNKINVDPRLTGYWNRIVYAESSNKDLGEFVPVIIYPSGEVVVLNKNFTFDFATAYKGYLHDGYFKWVMPDLQAHDGSSRIVAIRVNDQGHVDVLQGDYGDHLNTGKYEKSLETSLSKRIKLKPDSSTWLDRTKRDMAHYIITGGAGVDFSFSVDELPTNDSTVLLKAKRYAKTIASAAKARDKALEQAYDKHREAAKRGIGVSIKYFRNTHVVATKVGNDAYAKRAEAAATALEESLKNMDEDGVFQWDANKRDF